MLKWLKDRQLGNVVDRSTIYEHLIIRPKFAYKGIIDFDRPISQSSSRKSVALSWTGDGQSLLSLISEYGFSRQINQQMITVWEDPNTDTTRRIKSKVDLKQFKSQMYFDRIECSDSNVILAGRKINLLSTDNQGYIYITYICSFSLSSAKIETLVRKS